MFFGSKKNMCTILFFLLFFMVTLVTLKLKLLDSNMIPCNLLSMSISNSLTPWYTVNTLPSAPNVIIYIDKA